MSEEKPAPMSTKSNIAGKPLEILTDHGSQFYANFGEIKAAGISKFQQYQDTTSPFRLLIT